MRVLKNLVYDLEPRLRVPSHITVQRDCLKLYEEKKTLLHNKMVCLTIDTWISIQNLNYMCITAHFIGCDWKLHKKIIKFCLVSNHKGETIECVLENALIEWGIDSIFTITVDNAVPNDVGVEHMKKRIKDKDSAVLGGEFLHMRCVAHILNLVVKEGLVELEDSIKKD
jgi:hypothetical protein